MNFEIKNNELLVRVDPNIYNIDVLHKCFYWYGGDFNIDITTTDNSILIKLFPKAESNVPQDLNLLSDNIRRDLIDFKLRDIVTKETKIIRELIIAKAFAYYDIESNPSSDVSDPVGFITESIQA